MSLTFGSDVPDLLDRPANQETIIKFYAASAKALRLWEPGFELKRITLVSVGPEGHGVVDIEGIEYPLGHLGDRTVRSKVSDRISF